MNTAEDGVPLPQRYWAILTLVVGIVMSVLDSAMANIALPAIAREIGASPAQSIWVINAYQLAVVIALLPLASVGDIFGYRRIYTIGLVVFTLAALVSALSHSLAMLAVGRALQGVGAAGMMSVHTALVRFTYPRQQLGRGIAVTAVAVSISSAASPSIAAAILAIASWPWLFAINVPIGILTFVGLSAYLSETTTRKGAFDWFGFAMLSIAIGSFQMMLDRGEQLDWFSSTEIVIEAVVAALAFYLFLVQTFTAKAPFIDPHIFKDRNFTIGLCFIFVVGIILLASLALITPYLQNLMGYPVLTAGLVLAPRGMGTMVAMMVVGRIINRVDARILLAAGLLLTAEVLWEMTYFTPDVSQWTLIRTGVLQGMGLGFMFVPLSTITFSTLPGVFRTQGTALYSLMRNIGSSIGISLVIFLLTRNTQIVHSELVAHVTPFNDALGELGPVQFWNRATTVGLAALDAEVTKQASIVAYANDFKLMMLVALVALPLIFLLRRAKAQPGETAILE